MIGIDVPLSPEKWAKIRQIYALVIDEPEELRMAAALRLCGGDSQLESQIQGLLSAHERAASFLIEPAIVAMQSLPSLLVGQDLNAGTTLAARFRIEGRLDSGGMGTVYEAWDAELLEVVALKTIRPEIASEPAVIERFKEEVKQARQIAHPNICRVYDLFFHDRDPGERIWFLTMQLLQGKTLMHRLRHEGPFPRREALALAAQLVAGLSAAHELGVIHRDFKSANIMLVPAPGQTVRAVITDFGLAARATRADAGDATRLGQGTPAYVSPEQWLHGVASPAGDQYSLGVVLCEMICGERPVPPRLDSVPPRPAKMPKSKKLPPRWEKAICRCLAIEPEDRFFAVGDVLTALDPSHRRRLLFRWLAVAGCLLLAVGASSLLLVGHKPMVRDIRQLTPTMDLSTGPSLSRDGSLIAYASDRFGNDSSDIWVQHLPEGVPVRVTDDSAWNDDPTLSPDGHMIAFDSERNRPGVYVVGIDGRGEKLLAPGGTIPRFSPDGHWVLYWTGDDSQESAPGKIFVVSSTGGTPIQIASGFADARDAIWSSDGRHILFVGCPSTASSNPHCPDWWVTTIDGEAPSETGAMEILNANGMAPKGEFGGWYGDMVLFNAAIGRQTHLWELKIQQGDSKAQGKARELTPADPEYEVLGSSLAAGDVIALMKLSSSIHIWRIDQYGDRVVGQQSKVTQDADMDLDPSVSNNGRWLVFARGLTAERQIWMRDVVNMRETLFSTTGRNKYSPVIDNAGTTLAYESWLNGVPSVFISKSGSRESFQACAGCRSPRVWFNGNKGLLLSDASDSWVELYSLDTGRLQTVLKKQGSIVAEASWSPATQFLVFTSSDDRQRGQVFAARFPQAGSVPDRRWIAVTDPAEASQKPRWSGDGRTVFYLSDRDGFWCVWGRHFDPVAEKPIGKPFAVQHYHSHRFSPSSISARSFNLSVAGQSVYLNLAEMRSTISIGKLERFAVPFNLPEFR